MDDGLEALERRWRETGALEDEVRLLRARVREGRIAEAAVELAAALGHEAASEVIGGRVGPPVLDGSGGWSLRLEWTPYAVTVTLRERGGRAWEAALCHALESPLLRGVELWCVASGRGRERAMEAIAALLPAVDDYREMPAKVALPEPAVLRRWAVYDVGSEDCPAVVVRAIRMEMAAWLLGGWDERAEG